MSKDPIMFSEKDGFIALQPYEDPLVISAKVANYKVTWVFINNGIFVNVISFNIWFNRNLIWVDMAPLIALRG